MVHETKSRGQGMAKPFLGPERRALQLNSVANLFVIHFQIVVEKMIDFCQPPAIAAP